MSDEPPEVVDGVPVLADEVRVVEAGPQGALAPVAAQGLAVMGASMVAGAAAVVLVHRRRTRGLGRRRRRMSASVLASRSFLVDVHVLGERK
ncbi:MAG: hypothetical protein M3296_06665 [Actinomycetota bacterium]|nr:hypothetical protein [Actinomycetota bacterium]